MQDGKEKEAIVCLEQALKQKRKSWQIWENYIQLCCETKQFHKALGGARQLIRMDMMERLNASMMLRICDVFLKSYVAQATVADLKKEEFLVNKR